MGLPENISAKERLYDQANEAIKTKNYDALVNAFVEIVFIDKARLTKASGLFADHLTRVLNQKNLRRKALRPSGAAPR